MQISANNLFKHIETADVLECESWTSDVNDDEFIDGWYGLPIVCINGHLTTFHRHFDDWYVTINCIDSRARVKEPLTRLSTRKTVTKIMDAVAKMRRDNIAGKVK